MGSVGVVLLHGVGDDGDCFAPLVRALARDDLVAITPNAPAHGGQVGIAGVSLQWDNLVGRATDVVTALVERTGGPVILGGHSMGAATALGVAATSPELICGLFLEDPPFSGDASSDDAAASQGAVSLDDLGAWFEGLQTASVDEVVRGARHEHPDWPEDEYLPWATAKLSVDPAAFSEPVRWVRQGWSRLATSVTSPVLVLAGDPALGGLLTESAAATLARLPGWTIRRLPGVGHDVRRDARPAVVAQLGDFIDTIQAGRARI